MCFLSYFVLFILSVFSPWADVWAEQRVNERQLRVANSQTQLLAAVLSGSYIIYTPKKVRHA